MSIKASTHAQAELPKIRNLVLTRSPTQALKTVPAGQGCLSVWGTLKQASHWDRGPNERRFSKTHSHGTRNKTHTSNKNANEIWKGILFFETLFDRYQNEGKKAHPWFIPHAYNIYLFSRRRALKNFTIINTRKFLINKKIKFFDLN